MPATAIVLAAGRGERMGGDKALLDLGGRTAVERVVRASLDGGAAAAVVVRRAGDAALPPAVTGSATVVEGRPVQMIDSLRLAVQHLPGGSEALLVFPVDYAMVGAEVVAAVLERLRTSAAAIALPLWQERPGHPIALVRALVEEIRNPDTASLREVVARDPGRVAAVPVASAWVRRDLDTPEDLAAARAWLEEHQGE